MTEEWSGSAGPEFFSPDIQKMITTKAGTTDAFNKAVSKVEGLSKQPTSRKESHFLSKHLTACTGRLGHKYTRLGYLLKKREIVLTLECDYTSAQYSSFQRKMQVVPSNQPQGLESICPQPALQDREHLLTEWYPPQGRLYEPLRSKTCLSFSPDSQGAQETPAVQVEGTCFATSKFQRSRERRHSAGRSLVETFQANSVESHRTC